MRLATILISAYCVWICRSIANESRAEGNVKFTRFATIALVLNVVVLTRIITETTLTIAHVIAEPTP